METITLLEHEALPVVASRTRGQKTISSQHAGLLSRLEGGLPAGAFAWGHGSVRFAQYCGVISIGDLTLEILPKIYGKETDPGASRYSLIRMLARARVLQPAPGGSANIAMQQYALLDVFILHFCERLHAQLLQGMIRCYMGREENLPVLRGRLLIEQQMRHNLAHRERLYCRYDLLSEDNDYNRILKHVLRILLRLAVGNTAQKKAAEMVMRFDHITDRQADARMLDGLVFDRTTSRYQPLFEQCRWFLRGLHPDVVSGGEPCFSLLFDMNRLFEAYVAGEMRKLAWGRGLRMRTQGPRKYLARREDTGQDVFMMMPDMAFLDEGNRVVAIADAKWKLLDDSEKKLGISQADLYQMMSYARRYRVDRLALIYPRQQFMQKAVVLELQGTNVRLEIVPVDVDREISVPDAIFLEGGQDAGA